MKILDKIKVTNWFWYLILFVVGSFIYDFQSSKYVSIVHIKFHDIFNAMVGVVFLIFLIQAIGIAVYNVVATEMNLNIKDIDINATTPLFIIVSIFFLTFLFFPLELKTQVLEHNLNKINTIISQDSLDFENDIYEIQELSNLEELFPDTSDYGDSEY